MPEGVHGKPSLLGQLLHWEFFLVVFDNKYLGLWIHLDLLASDWKRGSDLVSRGLGEISIDKCSQE